MHCQLLLSLKINTRKVRQKDIENNNHISNKDRDKRNKKEIQEGYDKKVRPLLHWHNKI